MTTQRGRGTASSGGREGAASSHSASLGGLEALFTAYEHAGNARAHESLFPFSIHTIAASAVDNEMSCMTGVLTKNFAN